MTTNTAKKTLSSEELQKRNEVKRANIEAAKAFLPEAEKEYAKLFGVDFLDEVQKKALGELLMAKAKQLHQVSLKKSSAAGVMRRDPASILTRMLQKAFGYAASVGIVDPDLTNILVEASKNPIHLTPQKNEEGQQA
jgi:hypothetical protein